MDYNIKTWMKYYKVKLSSKLKGQTSLSLNGDYINSGVLLFNNSVIRRKNLYDLKNRIKEIVSIGYKQKFDYADQDVINLCFDITYIPDVYNKLYRFSPRSEDDVFLHHIADKTDFDKLQKHNT